jgi:BirA family biotin operon repressor/biotin-[acetyl-CoA-carboxylase] ligase
VKTVIFLDMIVYLEFINWFTIKMKIIKHKKLLGILQDNQFHSGEFIGKQLRITRAAVWKLIQSLQELGFEIEGISRRGYRLVHPFSFLSLTTIKKKLRAETNNQFKLIELMDQIDSTNTYLLQRMYEYSKTPRICLAEQQLHGRGRRDRHWHSPFGQNIYLSILWRMDSREYFHTLPLVVCLSIIKTLEDFSIPTKPQLKWPNDIYVEGKKLGGVLIETHSEVNENTQAVIGIGLNVNMMNAPKKMINQPWISLLQIFNKVLDRNVLVSRIIENCVTYLELFQRHGFNYFKNLWNQYDICSNQFLKIQCHDLTLEGLGQGVDQYGRLQISISKHKKMNISAGEIVSQIKNGVRP